MFGAFLFYTLLRVSNCNCMNFSIDLVHTVMINDALDVFVCIDVFGFSETLLPAVGVIVTLVVAEFESSNASSIVFTILLLCFAILFDAFLGSVQDNCDSSLFETIICLSTFCYINSCLTSF